MNCLPIRVCEEPSLSVLLNKPSSLNWNLLLCVRSRHHFVTASRTSCVCCVGVCNGCSQVRGREGRGLLNQIEATDPIIHGTHTYTRHSLHNYTEIKNGKRAKISVRQSVCLADRQSAYGWQLRCNSCYSKPPRRAPPEEIRPPAFKS
jgi:hypothetical protein